MSQGDAGVAAERKVVVHTVVDCESVFAAPATALRAAAALSLQACCLLGVSRDAETRPVSWQGELADRSYFNGLRKHWKELQGALGPGAPRPFRCSTVCPKPAVHGARASRRQRCSSIFLCITPDRAPARADVVRTPVHQPAEGALGLLKAHQAFFETLERELVGRNGDGQPGRKAQRALKAHASSAAQQHTALNVLGEFARQGVRPHETHVYIVWAARCAPPAPNDSAKLAPLDASLVLWVDCAGHLPGGGPQDTAAFEASLRESLPRARAIAALPSESLSVGDLREARSLLCAAHVASRWHRACTPAKHTEGSVPRRAGFVLQVLLSAAPSAAPLPALRREAPPPPVDLASLAQMAVADQHLALCGLPVSPSSQCEARGDSAARRARRERRRTRKSCDGPPAFEEGAMCGESVPAERRRCVRQSLKEPQQHASSQGLH